MNLKRSRRQFRVVGLEIRTYIPGRFSSHAHCATWQVPDQIRFTNIENWTKMNQCKGVASSTGVIHWRNPRAYCGTSVLAHYDVKKDRVSHKGALARSVLACGTGFLAPAWVDRVIIICPYFAIQGTNSLTYSVTHARTHTFSGHWALKCYRVKIKQ